MRSGPLIHQDHEPSIRVDEDQEFDCLREDEESQLPERLRNLNRTPSDAGRVVGTTREAEELR